MASIEGVNFADICLRDVRISGPPYNPGQGGWPTVRYFNKKTGPDGEQYKQQTSERVCTELGPTTTYLKDWVDTFVPGAAAAPDSGKDEL